MKIFSPALSRLARLRYWRIEHWVNDPVAAQREVLQDLITHGQYTQFGRKYQFAEIFNIRKFKETVPIHEYEDLNNSLKKKDGKNFTILFKNTKGIIKESKQNQQLKNTNKNKSKQKIVDNLVKKYVDNKTYIVKNNKKLTVVNKIRTTLIITKNLDKRLGKLIKIRYIKSKEEIKCSKIVEKTKIGITITKSNTYKKENNTEKWISDNQQIKKNQAILFLKFEKGKIADIIEGLPKIQQILENAMDGTD